jgi:hypothetical protein
VTALWRGDQSDLVVVSLAALHCALAPDPDVGENDQAVHLGPAERQRFSGQLQTAWRGSTTRRRVSRFCRYRARLLRADGDVVQLR